MFSGLYLGGNTHVRLERTIRAVMAHSLTCWCQQASLWSIHAVLVGYHATPFPLGLGLLQWTATCRAPLPRLFVCISHLAIPSLVDYEYAHLFANFHAILNIKEKVTRCLFINTNEVDNSVIKTLTLLYCTSFDDKSVSFLSWCCKPLHVLQGLKKKSTQQNKMSHSNRIQTYASQSLVNRPYHIQA